MKMLATGLLAILITSAIVSAQQPEEKMVTVAAITPEMEAARAAARVHFERAIAIADEELATATSAMQDEYATLQLMLKRAARGEVSLTEVQAERITIKAVGETYLAKKERCLSLRSEAVHLNIPVRPMPPKPPLGGG